MATNKTPPASARVFQLMADLHRSMLLRNDDLDALVAFFGP